MCDSCKKKIKIHTLFALRKYDSEHEISDEKLFCSKNCLDTFSEDGYEDYEQEELSRCASYYDCQKLDNLRGLCEKSESIEDNSSYLFPIISPINFCKPAEAGIIKSTIKLYEQAEKSSKQMNIQFIITLFLTVVIVLLTIFNIVLIVGDNSNSQLEVLNNKIVETNTNLNDLIALTNSTNNDLIEVINNKDFQVVIYNKSLNLTK